MIPALLNCPVELPLRLEQCDGTHRRPGNVAEPERRRASRIPPTQGRHPRRIGFIPFNGVWRLVKDTDVSVRRLAFCRCGTRYALDCSRLVNLRFGFLRNGARPRWKCPHWRVRGARLKDVVAVLLATSIIVGTSKLLKTQASVVSCLLESGNTEWKNASTGRNTYADPGDNCSCLL